jgi:hypothetical protein
MTRSDSPERFLRRFLDTYERRDLDALWSFYGEDCRFPVLERFGIEPSWDNYKRLMTTFIDAFLTSITTSRNSSKTVRTCGLCTP